MKMKFLAILAGAALVATGCVKTVSDSHSMAVTWSTDQITQRYQRSIEQVYQAAVTVVQNNGVVLSEYIPHDTTNSVRALTGKVNQRNVWVRVEGVDSSITQLTVQSRSNWGVSDVALSSQLVTEIALQLSR
jgi:hypothetical protein